MIQEYKKGNKIYKFIDDSVNYYENVFTVLVGKNGTGKSRLLGNLIRNNINESNNYYLKQKELGFASCGEGVIKSTKKPAKIIAVSTSPFDKFPLQNLYKSRELNQDNYCYVGIRDLRHHNFSLAFMSKIIGSLMNIAHYKQNQFFKISDVLNYLGYSDRIHASFDVQLTRRSFDELIANKKIPYEFEKLFELRTRSNNRFFRNENNEIDVHKIEKIINILNNFDDWRKKKYEITISVLGIDNIFDYQDFSFLVESGMLKLRNVGLKKLDSQNVFRISEASSGEQCIFTTFLGIACEIQDNSLIFIDEPEISLHPSWQEKYITLLMTTFRSYKNCHFIIATHSPQLISRLDTDNCFILKMDNSELKPAKEYINHSIDFQLASIFNAPGYKNEYLNRLVFSIMAKIAKTKVFDQEDLSNYKIIESQISFMEDNDPLKNLFYLLTDLKRKYA
ncbi:AAA family ATPase [Ancylomarina sp. 16SWW S1-10-2]|uniref:AAA family ATPase n=1 Tax=Ancylomarina sp. 16SWW S1-10-2 TaxID=2499681 RepID=UPI0012AD6BD9|nr:AAA family ATPase [Ancylomarina sp. 16SWW S1-10-2]MRT93250.1 ATP-binding protein [Ancylomarina sp. 16SWW S1-10-2]